MKHGLSYRPHHPLRVRLGLTDVPNHEEVNPMILLFVILIVGSVAWALWAIGTSDMPRLDQSGHDLTPAIRHRRRRP